ncbi:MAG TPA: hypothetical protein VKV95_02375 [Terriglobia bacterium]|nr:hypothetical protein [Terriglobia bacterium]
MKSAIRLMLLIGVIALAWISYGPSPALILAGPQLVVPQPPNAPPSGPQIPGDPTQLRAPRPRVPPDFQVGPKDSRPERKTVDSTKAQREAEELEALAKKIQGEVGQLSKNILPKDLDEDLKHIQKLAKHMRGEITP